MEYGYQTNVKGRVARILFNNPKGTLTKYRIAKLAGATYPWIHTLLRKLEKLGFIQQTKIIDFKGLMKWWLQYQPPPKYRSYMIQKPLELLREADLQYALTTYQAENMVQNYLFPSRTEIHIRLEDKQKWHELLAKKGLVGGGNVRIYYGDDHVFYNSFERRGLTLASIPQLIFDLYSEKVFCVEAADMLLEKEEKIALQ